MKFENINLFPTDLYKIKINPSLYSKEKIIEPIERNFKKNPKRNKWDKYSELYHLYDDFENEDYEEQPLKELVPIYDSVFKEFIDMVNWRDEIEYKWNVANVAVYGKDGGYMEEHSHAWGNIVFSAVHYLSLPENNKEQVETIRFFNPLVFLQYPTVISSILGKKLSETYENSTYFHAQKMNFQEDDMIIFPSYLNHAIKVFPNNDDKLRISIAMNVTIDENKML